MTALTLVAAGVGFAVCAWVTAAATSPWALDYIGRRRRHGVIAGFIAAAGTCEIAACVVLLFRGAS